MSTDEEKDALPKEDQSTAAEAAPKKRATKKAAKKATKKPASKKSGAAKDLGDTGSDMFTPGEIFSVSRSRYADKGLADKRAQAFAKIIGAAQLLPA